MQLNGGRDWHTRASRKRVSYRLLQREGKSPLFPRSSTCQRVMLSWFHAPGGAFATVEGADHQISAVRSIIQQRIVTLALSLFTRGTKINGTLERETRERVRETESVWGFVQFLTSLLASTGNCPSGTSLCVTFFSYSFFVCTHGTVFFVVVVDYVLLSKCKLNLFFFCFVFSYDFDCVFWFGLLRKLEFA